MLEFFCISDYVSERMIHIGSMMSNDNVAVLATHFGTDIYRVTNPIC